MRGLAALLALPFVASGCTTYADDAVHAAMLSETPDNATRDLIRTYVFDVLGHDHIVDIEDLTRSDVMMARDRGRASATGRPRIVEPVEFRLELADTPDGPICRLVTDLPDAPALVLPREIGCNPVSSAI